MSFITNNKMYFNTIDQFSLARFKTSIMLDFISKMDEIIQEKYNELKNIYPEMTNWFGEKYKNSMIVANKFIMDNNIKVIDNNIEELRYINDRPILLYIEKNTLNLAAMCLMKISKEEEKICFIYVKPQYRKLGICTDILKKTHDILPYNVDPIMTVAEENIKEFPCFPHILAKSGYVFTKIEKNKNNSLSTMFQFKNSLYKVFKSI